MNLEGRFLHSSVHLPRRGEAKRPPNLSVKDSTFLFPSILFYYPARRQEITKLQAGFSTF